MSASIVSSAQMDDWLSAFSGEGTSAYLVQELGREPTPDEIAEKMGLPLDKVRKVLKLAKEPISLPSEFSNRIGSTFTFTSLKRFAFMSATAYAEGSELEVVHRTAPTQVFALREKNAQLVATRRKLGAVRCGASPIRA